MIDWVTMVVPCGHFAAIHDGHFAKLKRDGTLEWDSARHLQVQGSFDSSVSIRSAPWAGDHMLEISGNLAKFMQGHNLWGTDDLPGLVFEFMRWLALNHGPGCESMLIQPNETDVAAWRAGEYQLTRVDVTASFSLRSRSEVVQWLTAAEASAHLPHRGRGQLCKGSTLYWGKHSRRWSLKLYAKGQEVDDNIAHQPALLQLPHARAWADNILRAEMCLRSLELKRRGLAVGTAWFPVDGVPFDALETVSAILGNMTMTTTRTLSDDVLATLTAGQKHAYLAWVSGVDLRDTMSKAAFYKLRAKLLPHGVDVSTLQPSADRSNVIPMVRVLEAVPVQVPEWAVGTPLFFEPCRLQAA